MEVMKVPDQYSDCRMYCYRLLLSYYGIEADERDLFGIGEGLDFALIDVLPARTNLYCPIGRSLNLELTYSHKMGIPVVSGKFVKTDGKERNIQIVRDILGKYGPIVVNIDRYYLEYLECDKAHMGFHTICVSVDHNSSCTFDVYDALAKNNPVSLSYESFLEGVFSDCIMSTGAEFYYMDGKKLLNRINTALTKEALANVGDDMKTIKIPMIRRFLKNLEAMRDVCSQEPRREKYLDIQYTLFLNTFIEQETSHMFYRGLLFDFIERYEPDVNMATIRNVKKSYLAILDDLNKDYETRKRENFTELLKELIDAEETLSLALSKRG